MRDTACNQLSLVEETILAKMVFKGPVHVFYFALARGMVHCAKCMGNAKGLFNLRQIFRSEVRTIVRPNCTGETMSLPNIWPQMDHTIDFIGGELLLLWGSGLT